MEKCDEVKSTIFVSINKSKMKIHNSKLHLTTGYHTKGFYSESCFFNILNDSESYSVSHCKKKILDYICLIMCGAYIAGHWIAHHSFVTFLISTTCVSVLVSV